MRKRLKFIISIVILISVISFHCKVNATENVETNNQNEEKSSSTVATETKNQNNSSNNQVAENSPNITTSEQTQNEQTESNTEPAVTTAPTTTTQSNKQSQSSKSNNNQKKSSNANLKMLGINPNDFSGFKTGTTTYNVTVPNNVEQVKVYATAQDAKATILGIGNKKLNVGQNELTVTVKAEDGTEKKYTINVKREESNNESDEDINNENKTEEKNDLTKLEIEGYTLSPKFSPSIYEYKINIGGDVTDLNVITKGKDENVKIEVVGNTSLHEGENVITILVTNNQTNENATYQITATKSENIGEKNEEKANMEPAIQKAKKIRYICIGLITLVVIGIVSFILIRRKKIIDEKSYDKYEYDIEDQDRINLDNEEELFNRVNKEKLKKIEPEENKEMIEKEKIRKFIMENEKNDETIEQKEEFFRTTSETPKGKHF